MAGVISISGARQHPANRRPQTPNYIFAVWGVRYVGLAINAPAII
jgi:hypothetical protein